MSDKDKVNDIVNMIDHLMETGQKHINLKVDNSGKVEVEKISVKRQTDCSEGDTACKIPTMFYEDREISE